MKQLKFLFLVLIGILVSTPFTSCGSEDDEPNIFDNEDVDAVVDGIAYKIENLEELTVSVVPKTIPSTYSGAITIPSTVNINGKSFTVTSVYQAFYGCSITSVTLPSTLKVIGSTAFGECSLLKSVLIPSSVTEIQLGAFYQSGLEKITIPSTVEIIGLGAFEDCKNLKSVTIEDSPQPLKVNHSVGYYQYNFPFNDSLIETLYCGRDITNNRKNESSKLGVNGAIYVNDNWNYTLKYLTLGENITEMWNIVSMNCTDLKTITCKSTEPPVYNNSDTPNKIFMETIVYVPASAVEAYKENESWGKFWNIEAIK